MDRLGTISFQSSDSMDVFLVSEVREDGIELSDEALLKVEDAQFDSDKAWVTGKVPKIKPVYVAGDTATIQAWFKGDPDSYRDEKFFVITVYVECELTEELIAVDADEAIHDQDNKEDLEPQEINL
jgi:hypothetical protein